MSRRRNLLLWSVALGFGSVVLVVARPGLVDAGVGVGVDVDVGARQPLDGEPRSGTATFTDLTGGGACAFPGEPPDNLHVGISSREYGTADLCGAYLDVTGPRGTVRVQVTDHCRNCPPGLIDITRKAFTAIADVDEGRVPVTYRVVRDPALARPISLRVTGGSSRWWLALQVLDHGNPLDRVELATGKGGWRALERTADNRWVASTPGPGDGPFTVRITDVHGRSATVYDVALAPDRIQHTVARLYHASPPAPTTPPPPAPEVPRVTTPPATAVAPLPVPPTSTPGSRPDDDGDRDSDDDAVAAAPPDGSSDGRSGGAAIGPLFLVLGGAVVALWLRGRLLADRGATTTTPRSAREGSPGPRARTWWARPTRSPTRRSS